MKRCLAGLCLLLMLLTACTARSSQTPVTAKDDAARRAWLEQQGWQTEEQPVRTLTVQLSLEGQEDYLALQQEAGLPLADYDGQTVTRCTYTVTNYPGRTGDVQVNLYLCGDVIVGGDIMALGEIRAALIDGDIQDFLRFGDRVQHIGEIGPQLLQRTDLRQVHGPHIEEQQECAGC